MAAEKFFKNGIIRQNPLTALLLGVCPAVIVTTKVSTAFWLGLTVICVMLCSSVMISGLKRIINDEIRIPCYMLLIITFVSIFSLIFKAYIPAINEVFGQYLILSVSNCLILGRAEIFARKRAIKYAAMDALGMGTGYMLILLVMAAIRQTLGGMEIFMLVPGGLFVLGIIVAIINKITGRKEQEE